MITLVTVNFKDGTEVHLDIRFDNYVAMERYVAANYEGWSSLVVTVLAVV
jgi:hypothetical protein